MTGVGGRRFYFPNERRGHAADVALRRRAITETMSASGASIIEQGDLEALGARVAAGDDVDGRDKHKRTALHLAAWAGQVRPQISAPPSLRFVVFVVA